MEHGKGIIRGCHGTTRTIEIREPVSYIREIELPDTKTGPRDALLLLGCPQVPIQTSVALYLAGKLRKQGITTVITGNRAARTNIEVADPDHHYIGEVIDIDRCIAQPAIEKAGLSLLFFLHSQRCRAFPTQQR